MHSPYATTIRPLDICDDVSLAVSQQQRLAMLKEDLRVSLLLEPIETAPAEGETFSAYLTNGARVTAERFDDRFVAYDREHPNMFRRPIMASEFVGWLKDDEDGDGGLPPLVPREDEYSTAAALGREED